MPSLRLNPFQKNPLRLEEAPTLVVIPPAVPEREPRRNLLTPVSSGLASQIASALSATVAPGAPVPTRKVVEERVQYREAPTGASPDRRSESRSVGSAMADDEDL